MEAHENMKMAETHQQSVDEVREAVRAAIRDSFILQTEIARQTGLSAPTISAFLAGSYKGRNDEVARTLAIWLASLRRAERVNAGLGKAREFVETPTALAIDEVCDFVRARGSIGVIAGATGIGKSKTLAGAGKRNGRAWYCQFMRSEGRNDGRKVNAVVRAVARAVNVDGAPAGSGLLSRMIASRLAGTRGLLILDEAQHLNRDQLEEVRSIYDATEEGGHKVGLILAGHLDLVDKVAAMPQLDGRVGRRLVVASATETDVDALCEHWGLACSQARRFLRERARGRTGLRRIASVYELAVSFAAKTDAPVSYEHVRSAWRAFDGSGAR